MNPRLITAFAGVILLLCSASWAQVTKLGPEFQVNTFTTDFQAYPSVATDDEGNFVVVWSSYEQDFSYGGIFGQRYANDGTPRGTEFQVNTRVLEDQYFPDVASDSAGNFVVVWSSYGYDGDYIGVFGQRFRNDGTPLDFEFQVNTETLGYQGLASVASAPDGRFVVVWSSEQQDGSDFGVFGQRYDSAGVPDGTEFQVNTYTDDYQGGGSVAVDANGEFVVVWTNYGQDGDWYGIAGQRFDSNGLTVGTEFQVNTYTEDDQLRPSVAWTDAGRFVVTWQSEFQNGASSGVFAQRFDAAGSPEGSEFRVTVATDGDQTAPEVAADSDGNFVVTWTDGDLDGNLLGVFGRRFDNSGTPLTDDFQVNTTTADDQTYQSVAVSDSGQFVVAWSSFDQDGDGFGVFGQRFLAGEASCPGDCNADRMVTVDELVRGVNIALGNAELSNCPAFDTNNDGSVAVNELIQGVNAALGGCPAA